MSFIDSLSIDKDVLKLALSVIDQQRDSVVAKNEAVIASLQNKITDAERSLSELLTIKLRKLLSDEDFLSRKAELEREISQLNSQLAKTKRTPNYISQKSIEVFEVVSTMKTKFRNGSKRERRSILRQVGSNLTFTDKKLLIQAEEPFNHFQKFQLALRTKNIRFEPRNFSLPNTQSATKSDGLSAIQSLVNSVRTYFSTN